MAPEGISMIWPSSLTLWGDILWTRYILDRGSWMVPVIPSEYHWFLHPVSSRPRCMFLSFAFLLGPQISVRERQVLIADESSSLKLCSVKRLLLFNAKLTNLIRIISVGFKFRKAVQTCPAPTLLQVLFNHVKQVLVTVRRRIRVA